MKTLQEINKELQKGKEITSEERDALYKAMLEGLL